MEIRVKVIPKASKTELVGYLKEMRSTKAPGPLRPRLTTLYPAPETALDRHLMALELGLRTAAAGN